MTKVNQQRITRSNSKTKCPPSSSADKTIETPTTTVCTKKRSRSCIAPGNDSSTRSGRMLTVPQLPSSSVAVLTTSSTIQSPIIINSNSRSLRRRPEMVLYELATSICDPSRHIVFITGAGLSVDSGIRPFRSNHSVTTTAMTTSHPPSHQQKKTKHTDGRTRQDQNHNILYEGLWNDVIWTTATRAAFRKDPMGWYTKFWNIYFHGHNHPHQNNNCSNKKHDSPPNADTDTSAAAVTGNTTSSSTSSTGNTGTYQPNVGHYAMDQLLNEFQNVRQITQNIDGLQQQPLQQQQRNLLTSNTTQRRLIEVHGRCGLYKCCPDSDTEDDDDEEDQDDIDADRPVILGHRRTSAKKRNQNPPLVCPYQYVKSLTEDQIIWKRMGDDDDPVQLQLLPTCPVCSNVAMPQALLFDEGYHSHSFYEFELVEEWITLADVIILVGTSCAVQLTLETIRYARTKQIPIYNFNLHHLSTCTNTDQLNAYNIIGPTSETLPLLLAECRSIRDSNN
jgi:NAD-dependent SIR2 family protein deacetylase